MALTVTHTFVSTIPDSSNTQLVRPSNWNGPASHAVSGTLESSNVNGVFVTDGDKGDITVSSTGTVWTIDNSAVTYAKIQNVSASPRLLGRISSGAGNVEELTGAQATTFLSVRQQLTANITRYIRTNPQEVTITAANPGVVSWSSHGLSINDPVVFSAIMDRGECTITIAIPGVVTKSSHGYTNGQPISFNTSGSLPTGIVAETKYYAKAVTLNTFEFEATIGGGSITTSGTQSGHHYVRRQTTLPNNVTDGGIYYVIATDFGPNSFKFSASVGGPAVDTSGGSPEGKIVAQTGNDANDGTANDRAHACLSLWAAWESTFPYIDMNGFDVFFIIADGTYLSFPTTPPGGLKINVTDDFNTGSDVHVPFGEGDIFITGNLSSPDNVNFISASTSGFQFGGTGYRRISQYFIRGMRITAVTDAIGNAGQFLNVDTLNFGGGSNFIATGSPMGMTFGTGNYSTFQILADPTFGPTGFAGGIFPIIGGGQLGLQFTDVIRAIGTRNVTMFWLTDDEEGAPPTFNNQGAVWDGNWTGTLYFAQFGGQLVSFTANAADAGGQGRFDYPSTLERGGPSDSRGRGCWGRYWERYNTTGSFNPADDVTLGKYGTDGVPVDSLYRFDTLSTGSLTVGNYEGNIILASTSGTIAAATITMPPNPSNGQIVKFRTSEAITALTVSPNAGQSILGNPTTLSSGGSFDAIYRYADTTWYCGS